MIYMNRNTPEDINDFSAVIDAILSRPGVKISYFRSESEDWITCIGDREMETAIREMPEIEQQIIRKFFLQDKCFEDIGIQSTTMLSAMISAFSVTAIAVF